MPTKTELISTRSGLKLLVEKAEKNGQLELSLRRESGKNCVLHWGLRRGARGAWEMPPQSLWPEDTRAFGPTAVQTAFTSQNGEGEIVFHLAHPAAFSIDFALFFPEENRWDNNNGVNYRIEIAGPPRSASPAEVLKREIANQAALFEQSYSLEGSLGGNHEDARQLAAAVVKRGGFYQAILLTDLTGPPALHWGIARRSSSEWLLPPDSLLPPQTIVWQNSAAQTPFTQRVDGLGELRLDFKEKEAPLGVPFILRQIDTGHWIKDGGANFFLPIGVDSRLPDAQEFTGMAQEIVGAEMGRNSWTLMHRFNLCYDLLDRTGRSMEGWALLFVWLRFSALRQLDWQRNYNTKPRELSHSQERLTVKLAELYTAVPASRPLVRLMMTTVGRGGEGQKIRDEILGIMHRHNIKEMAGHFMEEWHQKLHNNTTPDDVVIGEAYLAFLRSNGNLEAFYNTLQAGGVTRARLESFERPIKTDPTFVSHLKEPLINDFEHFLRTLKAVHSGTDLETAIQAANGSIDEQTRGVLSFFTQHRDDPQVSVVDLADKVTEARRRLGERLNHGPASRDLCYLDLALEQSLRVMIERIIHLPLGGDLLVDLIGRVAENLVFSTGDAELARCFRHWERLKALPRFGRDWSLHAKSVADRLGRALGTLTDSYYRLLQPKAEFLGGAFHADPWTITLFSEEVVRGGLPFALSTLLQHLNPILRQAAHLGDWEVISRGTAAGRVEVFEALGSIQGRSIETPTVVIADRVKGDEEIPEGVTAVITANETDILSHFAVRARNAKLLVAACYDSPTLEKLKSLRGHAVRVEVSASGEVAFREDAVRPETPPPRIVSAGAQPARPRFTSYAIPEREFTETVVGGKSWNQVRVRRGLPNWVHQPPSVAIPFGVFERVLALDCNKAVAERYQALVPEVENNRLATLSRLRQVVLELQAPDELVASLRQVVEQSGLARSEDWTKGWDAAWACIKRVWASKWNERAYLARSGRGFAHEALFMAVLIQQVVEAEYAFVIHTVNPFSGASSELYAEVVPGLGETLVGNYPGRALSFASDKKSLRPNLLAYPSKSVGLYGGGLIFRSDSNGEDLAGYAGAGLYDSFMLTPAGEVPLDYTQDRLVWDGDFRRGLLVSIATIGLALESALGVPQDIEGAYSKGDYYVVQARPQAGLRQGETGE